MATHSGSLLLATLLNKKHDLESAQVALESAEAIEWAQKRAVTLRDDVERTAFGTLIMVLDLAAREPSRLERLKLDALDRELGIGLSAAAEKFNQGQGREQFWAVAITPEKLLDLLQNSSR